MRFAKAAFAMAAGLWLASGLAALAQDDGPPTPRVVIYPGDIIRDDMLSDLAPDTAKGASAYAETRADVLGKMARRTLLPGQAIPIAGVDNPRLVSNGAAVKLILVDGGLTIVTSGSAMQDGAIGDTVKVRNDDSGIMVTGVIRPDGAVLVSGG